MYGWIESTKLVAIFTPLGGPVEPDVYRSTRDRLDDLDRDGARLSPERSLKLDVAVLTAADRDDRCARGKRNAVARLVVRAEDLGAAGPHPERDASPRSL